MHRGSSACSGGAADAAAEDSPVAPSDVDYKKLRKLILSRKLASCFDAIDDPDLDLEECPICCSYYPSLNRTQCCAKGICTECFLQMKPSNSSRPSQCPFCKAACYAVEYRGATTEEEKGLEQERFPANV